MEMPLLTILLFLLYPCRTLGGSMIETTSGLVEGVETSSPWGRLTLFYGVPYAMPPIRQNRFQVSRPIRTSEEAAALRRMRSNAESGGGGAVPVRVNTLSHPPPCPQLLHGDQEVHPWLTPSGLVTNEDCLKLNVFVPSVPGVGNAGILPILVVVPGESLNFADSRRYNASALTSIGGIIVVTLNYRVGVFGFLSTGDEMLEGNGGLSDILSALEWVRLNGLRFGGNTSAITVAGTHWGSMMLAAVFTSPRFLTTKTREPLAQRLILHGGISTGRWAFEMEPMESFERLAAKTACQLSTVASKIQCLKRIPTKRLLAISTGSGELWKPVIDNSIILRDPLDVIDFGKHAVTAEMMIGENSGSGSLCYDSLLTQKSEYLKKIQSDTLSVDDLSLLIGEKLKEYFELEDKGLTAAVLHEYSFAGIPENSFRETFHHFCGMLFIRNSMELLARYASRFQSSIFRYEFSHHPVSSLQPNWLGAAIGDELPFLFPTTTEEMTVEDVHVFQNFTGSWINFVRKGYPALVLGTWPNFDQESKKMMIFTNQGMKLDSSRFLDRDVHFWRDTFTPLSTSLESCAIYKLESPENLCEKVELSEAQTYEKTKNSTNSFLILLISLLIVLTLVLGVIVLRNRKKR